MLPSVERFEKGEQLFLGHTCVLLGELLVLPLEVLFFGVAQKLNLTNRTRQYIYQQIKAIHYNKQIKAIHLNKKIKAMYLSKEKFLFPLIFALRTIKHGCKSWGVTDLPPLK